MGGVVGDDGLTGIALGPETAEGELSSPEVLKDTDGPRHRAQCVL